MEMDIALSIDSEQRRESVAKKNAFIVIPDHHVRVRSSAFISRARPAQAGRALLAPKRRSPSPADPESAGSGARPSGDDPIARRQCQPPAGFDFFWIGAY